MTRALLPRAVAAVLLFALAGARAAPAQEKPPAKDAPAAPARRLPFSDDVAPPPRLPVPLDRHLRGRITSFDGERVKATWDWTAPEQLEDFEPFVPVRATVRGGFTWEEGAVHARGTAGIRLRLGMLSDLALDVTGKLVDPHDLGVVLAAPGSSDESILCLVQDRLFTRFDAAAGNANMINKMGGIPTATPGYVEFRYVARSPMPRIDPGASVRFQVTRLGAHTTFLLTPAGAQPTQLAGKDTDTAMTRFTPGLYVAGAEARFGPLTIEGRIDPAWLAEHGVLPHFADDLLHAGNRFQGPDRRAAETVERFVRQDPAAEPDPKKLVAPETVAAFVGNEKLPLVIRIRAAEALAGAADGTAAERVAALLDAKELAARVLAWQVLRPSLPWHFRYQPDRDPAARREAALLVADYLRRCDDESASGKVFVDGYWYTPARADAIRAEWANAWDLRTPRVRLRTNLSREWADWYLAALEAAYAELVRVVGREPPPEKLPLSVFVFAAPADYAAFCDENGYEAKAAWGRFTDADRGVSFETFKKAEAPAWALGGLAKLYLRAATGTSWPTWFDEGRASWFGNGEYRTALWDGTTLEVGQVAKGSAVRLLSAWATQQRLDSIASFLEKDPRTLEGDALRVWYAQAWALHHWLMDVAPEPVRERFAEWQGVVEKLRASPRDVDALARRQFLFLFEKDLAAVDAAFRAWASRL